MNNDEENEKHRKKSEGIYKCDHKNCNKRFKSLKDYFAHHDITTRWCAFYKKEGKKKLAKTKRKLKEVRKENMELKKLLKKAGINYKEELKMKGGDQSEEGGEEDDEFFAFLNKDQLVDRCII